MPRKDGRIEKGQSLRSAISARAWNRAQDAADLVLGPNPGLTTDGNKKGLRAENLILVKNNSGRPVPRYGVLQLGSPVHIPNAVESADEFLLTENVVLNGVVPEGGNQPFAVAMEPIPQNAIGRMAISGRFVCKVKAITLSFGHARARNDDVTQLVKAACGPVRILWIEPGLGPDKWAVGVM